jgi:hypothetical protein
MEVALIAVAAGALIVRIGWRQRRGVAAAGWATIVLALGVLTQSDGAWGLATGTVAGMVAMLAMVLHAGWTAPAKARRETPARHAAAVPLQWRGIARRVGVFALVVPIAFVAAQWLTLGVQALARRGGVGDADAIVLTLMLQPVAWGIIMAVQMTRADAGRMIAAPAAAGLAGTMLWMAA